MFEKFVRQPRTPVMTVVSLLLTATVSLLLLALASDGYALLAIPGTALILAAGVVLNGVVGVIASSRDEHRGLEVAVGGMVLWFVIATVFACQGRYW